jgi:hypothetical protein
MIKKTYRSKRFMQEFEMHYINDNCRALTVKQLATALNRSEIAVYDALKTLKQKATKSCFQATVPVAPDPKEWQEAFTK